MRLAIALLKNDLELAENLLKKGADPNADVGLGRCQFLHHAITTTNLEAASLLISYQADPEGDHPLSIFTRLIDASLDQCTAYLDELGALFNQSRRGEITNRQFAVRRGKLKRRYQQREFARIKIDIAKVLIDAGASVNHFIHPVESAMNDTEKGLVGFAWFLMFYSEIDWLLVSDECRNSDVMKRWIELVEKIRKSVMFKEEGIACFYDPGRLIIRLFPDVFAEVQRMPYAS